jgi:hypothetical protein
MMHDLSIGRLVSVATVSRWVTERIRDSAKKGADDFVLHVTNELPIISPAYDVGAILRLSPQFCGRLETLGNGAVVRPRAIVPTALSTSL